MASTEAAVASLGPRYAPDDPTLPEPWKGLIDGSTGLLYYWNPETNVTQYEKPASVAPLPSATPAAATPKMAPIPAAGSVQQTNLVAQQGQQPSQAPNQQVEQVSHFPQHQVQTMAHSFTHVGQIPHQDSHAHTEQQQGSQSGQVVQHTGQYMQHSGPQMVHHHGHHMPQHTNQLGPQQAAQQVPQQRPAQQMPPHLGGSHVAQPQGHQYPSPLQYPAYQQNAQQQNQNSSQVQSFPSEQEYKIGFQKRDEVRPPQGSQVPFSPQFHQKGASAIQNPPSGSNVVQMPQAGYHFGPSQQFGGSSANVPQPNSMVQPQQSVTDLVHQQYGPRFQNQMGSSMMHGRAANAPHAGLKTGFEDNLNVSTKNEFYFNTGREGPMGAQQPKLAALPMARNQQEPRVGDVRPIQNNPGTSSVLHAPATRDVGNVYGHATLGPTFSDSPLIRPPFPGKSDANGLSSVEVYCQQHEVTTTGGNVPAPFMTFEATGFPPEILHEIHAAGFSAPTPIQAQTWPIAIQNRDIVAIAKTGSGKTLGYLIPAFMLLRQRRNNPQYGPTVLVLAPTRELATQIQDEAIKFGRSSRVSCTCLYGGAPKGPQLKELDRGTDIVVATPGRLNDILEMKKIDFRQVSLFVLDEADRMLDMGFEPQIRKIVNEIPPRRQTLMYTATWPKEVKKIASDLLRDPVQVNIGNVDELAANKSITQYVEVVPQFEKQRRLEQILRSQERGSKVIIFCSTKRLCDQLARSIGRHFGAAVIHGDKSQGERDWVLNQFRSGKCPVLVATDVAARGLDIKDIRVVINYDFPTGVEDYVHRIGRTGRAGASGVSYTFFSEQDWKHASELIKVLEGANQQVPPQVREIAMRGGPGFGKDRAGVNRFDSRSGGAGRWDSGGGRGGIDGGLGGRGGMDSGFGGRGGMDGGFGGHGGMDGGFGGRGGMGFGGRGGMRDGGFGGRGGVRDSGFGGRGGRNDLYSGRSNRGRGFGGGQSGWERNDRGPYDRYGNMDGRGRDRGRGRGRFDNRRGDVDRSRGRSRSRSPEKVRTWGYSSSSSRSRSRSRSRSWSRSPRRSRSRSWSRGRRSYSRSRSRERRYSRSRSRSYERNDKLPDHSSGPNDTVKPGAPELKISTVCPAPQSYVGCQDAVQLQVVDEGNELQNPKDVTALHVGDQTAT